MINCQDFNKTLEDFLDGTLDEVAKKGMLSHASACPLCKKTFESHAAISSKLKSRGQVSPPPDFQKTVMNKILPPASNPSQPASSAPSLLLMAGITLGLLVGGVQVVKSLLPRNNQSPGISLSHPFASGTGKLVIPQPDLQNASTTQAASQGVVIDKSPE